MSIRLFRTLLPFGRLGRRASLYEKVGGAAKIEELVEILYGKTLQDDQLKGFFADVCMHYQRYKLRVFLTMALGGPVRYTGNDLRSAHARLVERGLDDSHFDRLALHLRSTLEVLELGSEEIDAVLAVVESTRNEVLGR